MRAQRVCWAGPVRPVSTESWPAAPSAPRRCLVSASMVSTRASMSSRWRSRLGARGEVLAEADEVMVMRSDHPLVANSAATEANTAARSDSLPLSETMPGTDSRLSSRRESSMVPRLTSPG